jgi:hypothetical protein
MKHRSTGGWLLLFLALVTSGLAAWTGAARAQESPPVHWSAQLRSTGYFLQQAEPGATEVEDRLPFYEQVDAGVGNLLGGTLDFRFSGRYADDARFDGGVPQDTKWFVGYANARFQPMHTQVRVGRQFIQEGGLHAALDGGWLSLRPHRQWRMNAWVGSTAPGNRAFEFGDDVRYGGRVAWKATRQISLGAWGAQRTEDGTTLATEFGGEALVRPLRTLKLLARGTWETERSVLERADVLAVWQHRPDWPQLRGQFVQRSQRYEVGSWWEQFGDDLHDVQLLRGSARWTNEKGIGGELRGFGNYVDDRKNGAVGVGFIAPHLRVGVGYMSGDSGETTRFYGDVDWTFAHRIDVAAGASFESYGVVPDPTDDELRDLVSYYARGEVLILPGVEFMSELQILDNPIYSSDVRLLVGLDLMAGRGASRIGIGSGGVH